MLEIYLALRALKAFARIILATAIIFLIVAYMASRKR